jgi:purine-nucleoside phosphorylase
MPKYVIPFENVSSFYANPSVAIPKADEDLWREVYEYSINTKVKIILTFIQLLCSSILRR